jgi:hypothetical protein
MYFQYTFSPSDFPSLILLCSFGNKNIGKSAKFLGNLTGFDYWINLMVLLVHNPAPSQFLTCVTSGTHVQS